MEKNIVVINLEDYNNMLKMNYETNLRLHDALRETKALNKDFEALSVFAVRKAVKTYNLNEYKLEDLLKFDGYKSAIDKDDVNTLINLGVPFSTIVAVIKEMKEEADGNE